MSDNRDLERTLWAAADKLRSNIDAAEYKHVVLGLIFLKYISDAFEAKHLWLESKVSEGYDPEDRDEYLADKVFWVPSEARWTSIQQKAKQPNIGGIIDNAMDVIERDNASLKGVLPKNYARPDLDKTKLGELVDLISNIGFNQPGHSAKDLLGRVYEYFLGQFADAEGKTIKRKNLAAEMLRKILGDELRLVSKSNIVQSRLFSEMLENAVRRYQNQMITTVEFIEEMILMAKDMNNAKRRGEDLGLTEGEVAFYDALETNDSAVAVLGDEVLKQIALDLFKSFRENASIDWLAKESVRAKLRSSIKRVLRQHGYPPDKTEQAVVLILEQAELMASEAA